MTARRILHLVGSPTSNFYRELSELYARGCLDALHDPARYDVVIAHVAPHGVWRFPQSLAAGDIEAAETMNLAQAVGILSQQWFDAAVPQLFCLPGMTVYRSVLQALAIPLIGNLPLQMGMTADKAVARSVVAAVGVNVPQAELLRAGDVPTLLPPAVVKPNDADNSDGVTLVTARGGYAEALACAFAHSDAVLVERYIAAGREVRCGVIERDGQLVCLPLEEYAIDSEQRPIRTSGHKLKRDSDHQLALSSKTATESWIVDGDDPIVAAVHAAALRCYDALGCRHYGLFDFRIDTQGQPWFLEAGLYCSFSPQSVLVTMAVAAGIPTRTLFAGYVDQVAATLSTTSRASS